jgi:hypothetical protein
LEQGIAEYSWARVATDTMDPHQQRTQSFASVEVGTAAKPYGESGTAIPFVTLPLPKKPTTNNKQRTAHNTRTHELKWEKHFFPVSLGLTTGVA